MAKSAGIKTLKYWHDMIIDHIIALGPGYTLKRLSDETGYTVPWLSVLCNNDLFKARLIRRREATIHTINTDVKAKMSAVANKGLDRLDAMLPLSQDLLEVNKVTETMLNALGYSAKHSAPAPASPSVSNNFYIAGSDPSASVVARARAKLGKSSDEPKLLSAPRSESLSEPSSSGEHFSAKLQEEEEESNLGSAAGRIEVPEQDSEGINESV